MPGRHFPEALARVLLRGRHARQGNSSSSDDTAVKVVGFEQFLDEFLHLKLQKARRDTPTTFVGSVLLPALAVALAAATVLGIYAPARRAAFSARAKSIASHPAAHQVVQALAVVRQRFNLTADRFTTICVSCYFLHEGFAELQIKWTQVSQSLVPVRTPFGYMRMVPAWEKGDAVDLVLLVTAVCTASNVMPEVGLILLLVDVVTDVLHMLGQLAISYLIEGAFQISELMAKKVSLLGVMVMVTLHQWRKRQAGAQSHSLPHDDDEDSAASSPGVGSVALLLGRLLIAALFFHVAFNELGRLYLSSEDVDIDPLDGHNVVWPKVLELAFAIPLVLGWQTKQASRFLAATLALEAVSVWQFWCIAELKPRLHSREHFAVNVAVAGGLLLLQHIGGGRFAIEALLKKAS